MHIAAIASIVFAASDEVVKVVARFVYVESIIYDAVLRSVAGAASVIHDAGVAKLTLNSSCEIEGSSLSLASTSGKIQRAE